MRYECAAQERAMPGAGPGTFWHSCPVSCYCLTAAHVLHAWTSSGNLPSPCACSACLCVCISACSHLTLFPCLAPDSFSVYSCVLLFHPIHHQVVMIAFPMVDWIMKGLKRSSRAADSNCVLSINCCIKLQLHFICH